MSGHERWSAVDGFVTATLLGEDPILEQALRAAEQAGLPSIAVTAPQGALLALLARMRGARRILEVGTLGGYSTIWLARALAPGGSLVTLELQEDYARVAGENIERAGLSDRVEIRVGPAARSLRELVAQGAEPFDMAFIDADKASTPRYFELALALVRPGGAILVDNVVRGGELGDPATADAGAAAMRRLHERLAQEREGTRRLSATTIQTVGEKGYDGFTLVLIAP